MNIAYLLFLQDLRNKLTPEIEIFMGMISTIDVHFTVIFIPALLYWCFNKKNGEFVFFTYCLGDFINGFLKLSVCCYRPWVRDSRIIPSQYAISHATGYSFPSGHSVNAGTIFKIFVRAFNNFASAKFNYFNSEHHFFLSAFI